MGKFGLDGSDKNYIVKMDKSLTLCKPEIECETGALKKRGRDSETRDFTKMDLVVR